MRTIATLVKPSCFIAGEIERCMFDKAYANLFFGIVNRRHDKDRPNTIILTSNTSSNSYNCAIGIALHWQR